MIEEFSIHTFFTYILNIYVNKEDQSKWPISKYNILYKWNYLVIQATTQLSFMIINNPEYYSKLFIKAIL